MIVDGKDWVGKSEKKIHAFLAKNNGGAGRYKQNNWDLQSTPMIITWPRSGTHWVNACLEVYTGKVYSPINLIRPRIKCPKAMTVHWRRPSVPESKNKTMWHVNHDRFLVLETAHELGSAYLFRNPIDSIFSIQDAQLAEQRQDPLVDADEFVMHFNRWVVQGKAKTIITYEEMQADPLGVMKKLCGHLKIDYDPAKAQRAVDVMSKEALMSYTGSFGPALTKEDYAKRRNKFREEWGKRIAERVTSDADTRNALKKHMPSLFDDYLKTQ